MTFRCRIAFLGLAFATAAGAPAHASFGDRPERPAPPPREASAPEPTPRERAERLYRDAYDEVARARRDAEAGRDKSLEKRWRKALDRAREAAELDTTYHEAWNLVGFANRKLGRLPAAVAAYSRCLRLAPRYGPAREYYGEALLESGDVDGARDQLRWLRRIGDAGLIAELEAAFATHGHPTDADSTAAR